MGKNTDKSKKESESSKNSKLKLKEEQRTFKASDYDYRPLRHLRKSLYQNKDTGLSKL